ncbi:ribonuclease M5 [Desulfosporosinus orientis DSM 765]|uniref:Ribonuclease M5 n=1 Tax=Desulfosporosinus orientis (strain ATCC 19365 / DSM 765 / NCIMB 8382 / VKM B-1628 / Singapore I) TaxID=768706 RepID=G7W7D2_DESOD|nr:ribonuclease M5 [Desulfosporosinus orientis]AET65803.1 ribonuclease M5 [Desulfosporosinus orientis DSM 765]
MIKELIVVEGKNDAHIIRQALGDVDVIWTEGYGLTKKKLDYIAEMANRQGVIVFTDPDTVGEQIRNRIRAHVPQTKHVYITKKAATKNGDIGVENAELNEIRRAFADIKQDQIIPQEIFVIQDLMAVGLMGSPKASKYRIAVSRKLGIGDSNAKQFLHRLNRFGISREEFFRAIEEVQCGEGS